MQSVQNLQKKLVIHDIRHFLGLDDVASLCEMRRIKFLNKTTDEFYSAVINGTVLLIVFFLYYWMYCVC